MASRRVRGLTSAHVIGTIFPHDFRVSISRHYRTLSPPGAQPLVLSPGQGIVGPCSTPEYTIELSRSSHVRRDEGGESSAQLLTFARQVATATVDSVRGFLRWVRVPSRRLGTEATRRGAVPQSAFGGPSLRCSFSPLPPGSNGSVTIKVRRDVSRLMYCRAERGVGGSSEKEGGPLLVSS